MGFLEKIEKIQQKPKSSRQKILILSVGAIMILIIVIWIQTMRLNFSATENQFAAKDVAGPLKLLWETTIDGFNNLKKQLQNLAPEQ